MSTRIKKVNIGLMLGYIFTPVITALVASVALVSPSGENLLDSRIVLFVLALLIGYAIVFLGVASILFFANRNRFKTFCKDNGCNFDYFFYGNSTCTAIDIQRRTMGMIFRFNPFSPYVVSLDEVQNAKTDNGVSALSLGGTRGVHFSFELDGRKFKVWTFTANSTYSLKSDVVQEAIAKADTLVAAINS